ncbi:Na+/H+ antiporter subunit G1 [Staphylococcus agnetis]|uniref:Na+/H+ antiporter subunit G1 n=1 Tax=Staphylococcus agnetis TaxID=985762 RepID=A0ABD7TRM9_9STAP|nr:Na+/H+ antiporter subunit G1 [Staphylococcus agnetis]MCO4338873.1 Na+/H+ antiporter subunit G1 [Staphylococcus agnetis]MCO4341647.1 Na+/H+ antiporter subunit G1 [Staphylococcus agnetis]MCO4342781.1 Na+/H+ antiporter subunit G1 [Staphylococcus agnetis]MCO4345395.1 Na+/H+ antiporter subunit G1 [Staphylococcus agnetis]MCO4348709.1 Na+/H+ antiporter subunit G1 [Staphylococcus agnetis]
MTETIVTSIGVLLVIIGALFSALAAFGILKLDDVYSRAHAAGKAATLGAMLLLTGVFIYFIGKEGYVNFQLLIGIFFVFITGPLASHMILKAAYNLKAPASKRLKLDEVKKDLDGKKL